MVNKTLYQKGSAPIAIIIVLVIVLLGILGFVLWDKFTQKPVTKTDAESSPTQSATSRDATRKKHAQQMASALFSLHLLQNQTPEPNQQGLDSIEMAASSDPLTDPSTGKPYVFSGDQTSMKVGEAIFKINATCDNKVSGSNATGLIIDGSNKSVAVALKLESGTYACESNL